MKSRKRKRPAAACAGSSSSEAKGRKKTKVSTATEGTRSDLLSIHRPLEVIETLPLDGEYAVLPNDVESLEKVRDNETKAFGFRLSRAGWVAKTTCHSMSYAIQKTPENMPAIKETREGQVERMRTYARVHSRVTHEASLILPLAFLIGFDELYGGEWNRLRDVVTAAADATKKTGILAALDPIKLYEDILGILLQERKFKHGGKEWTERYLIIYINPLFIYVFVGFVLTLPITVFAERVGE